MSPTSSSPPNHPPPALTERVRKRWPSLVAVCLGLFLAFDFIAGISTSDQWAFDAAKACCREKGWQDGDLALSRSVVSGWILGKRATIEFTTKNRNQPTTVHVELRKPLNVSRWQVTAYHETVSVH